MCSGQNADMVLEEEIIELADKLEKLQRRSRNREVDVQKCCNFDKQASLLQRRLQKFAGESDEICVKEIQEMAEASLSSNTASGNKENFVSNSSSNVILNFFVSSLLNLISNGNENNYMNLRFDLKRAI